MIRANIYARYKDQKALAAVRDMPKVLSEALSHASKHYEPEDISIRVFKITAMGSMAAENEIEIMAGNDKYLMDNRDAVCKKVAGFLKENHKMDDCCVWLLVSELGFHRN